MRFGIKLIGLAMLLLVITSACASDNSQEADVGSEEVTGPALVMFYTDN